MKYYELLFIALLTTSCSSYRNISEEGDGLMGGGYVTTKLDEGLYRVTAKSNNAPIVNYSAAYKTLNRQAEDLCGVEGFELHSVSESNFEHIPRFGEFKYIISQVRADVFCKNSPKTYESIMLAAQERDRAEKEKRMAIPVDENLVGKCVDANGLDESRIIIEAGNLKSKGRYTEAAACYQNIISNSQNSDLISQSYLNLSMMYELGQGVDIDIDKAKELANLGLAISNK